MSETIFGIWIGDEPMSKLSRNITSMALGESVINALQFSQTKIPHPKNLELDMKEFLNFTGFKTWRVFSKEAFSISVTFDGEYVEITPDTPDGRGNFEPLLDKAVKCALQPEEIGNVLFSLFCE